MKIKIVNSREPQADSLPYQRLQAIYNSSVKMKLSYDRLLSLVEQIRIIIEKRPFLLDKHLEGYGRHEMEHHVCLKKEINCAQDLSTEKDLLELEYLATQRAKAIILSIAYSLPKEKVDKEIHSRLCHLIEVIKARTSSMNLRLEKVNKMVEQFYKLKVGENLACSQKDLSSVPSSILSDEVEDGIEVPNKVLRKSHYDSKINTDHSALSGLEDLGSGLTQSSGCLKASHVKEQDITSSTV
jgi:hypothetical protein